MLWLLAVTIARRIDPKEATRMSVVDYEALNKIIDIPAPAQALLSRPEKQIRFALSLPLGDEFFYADAYVVYYNTARGVAKGGIRFHPEVTLEETQDLAELMGLKTALTRIPFGGGKSGIKADPQILTQLEKDSLIKEFVHMIRKEFFYPLDYVPAPDMGTNPRDMAIIYGETHIPESVTGKPPRNGGLAGRREATGRGVAAVAALAWEQAGGESLAGATCAVQGFGNVGSWTCQFLADRSVRIVGVSDIHGGIYDEQGVDIHGLLEHVAAGHQLIDFGPTRISNAELLALPVDFLIPAASGEVLTEQNAESVTTKLIIEAANHPITSEGDAILVENGVTVVPDILANSGGVVASYLEWRLGKSGAMTTEQETYQVIDKTMAETAGRVWDFADERMTMRTAAWALAVDELVKAMADRGWF